MKTLKTFVWVSSKNLPRNTLVSILGLLESLKIRALIPLATVLRPTPALPFGKSMYRIHFLTGFIRTVPHTGGKVDLNIARTVPHTLVEKWWI